MRQLREALQSCGMRIRTDLQGKVDAIFIIDPRATLQKTAFGLKEIIEYKKVHPEVKIIHRINECDQRKNTDFMDQILQEANLHADYTVFISRWLRDYFAERWFDVKKSHCVIYNGASPAEFHPLDSACWDGVSPFRLVTHHWSDNPMKGFATYERLDGMIADGQIKDCELWVIGRWPADIRWKSARTYPPASGNQLADLLRQCHVYFTASLWEPCGMHHVEGAQCGLPLLCHADGGGIVEAAEKYGLIFNDEDLVEVVERAKREYRQLREKVLLNMPSGYRMNADYVRVIQYVLAWGRRSAGL